MVERFGHIEVSIVKLRDYCLSETHPRGRHKARVFRSRLGLTPADADTLAAALAAEVRMNRDKLYLTNEDSYGQRYRLDFDLETPSGKATIRSAWILSAADGVLKLVTCYVL